MNLVGRVSARHSVRAGVDAQKSYRNFGWAWVPYHIRRLAQEVQALPRFHGEEAFSKLQLGCCWQRTESYPLRRRGGARTWVRSGWRTCKTVHKFCSFRNIWALLRT